MLSPPRYLLGVAEVLVLAGFAALAGARLRSRFLPELSGAPAHLAAAVTALAVLIWIGEALGAAGLFEPLPYVVAVVVIGSGAWALTGTAARPCQRARNLHVDVAALVAIAIAAAALIHFALRVRTELRTGMTGFDSTWYHGPFAAGFLQSGNTFDLHFIAPQFLAWFYPANSELFHAVGMLAFGRDILSPLLNVGWFAGCLVAAWCIGRPYGVAPVSLALGAIALSAPVLGDQAGEARNDVVGTFFLLSAVAIAVNAWAIRSGTERSLSTGALMATGLAAGLAAGTKLNFLLPGAALVIGLALAAPRGRRSGALAAAGLAALAGGGYWYLRNLVHSGNPLPWFRHIGPLSLPAPEQALGGREGHSVLSYLTDGGVWSGWFLPGLHHGLWIVWPLLLAAALAGLLLCLGRRAGSLLRMAGVTGLALVLAWLIAPTAASGPPGEPRGFESGLRYLAPALILGLVLLPASPALRARLPRRVFPPMAVPRNRIRVAVGAAVALLAVIAAGYPVQRHYLRDRYANPEFTMKALDAAFKWARSLSGARIATTGTRQYPLFGTDLSNHVQYVGIKTPHGGFVAPTSCRAWRRTLNSGHYEYAVVTRDRIEPGRPAYPPTARWTEGPNATILFRKPPTVVFKLNGALDPSGCRELTGHRHG